MSNVKFTPDQLKAIKTAHCSLLVSAAAGSGKTAVLAERCVYLVCDAPPEYRCAVDELLVLTFTTASAEEMRSRVGKVLRARVEKSADPRTRKQLVLLDRAQISTVHGLCSNLLRQHFHAAGIDPAFRTLDGDESTLLRRRVARDLVEAQFDDETPGPFHRLIEEYALGMESVLIDNVLRTDEHLASMFDPAKWVTDSLARLQEAADKPLDESELGRAFLSVLQTEMSLAVSTSEQVRVRLAHVEGAGKYAAHYEEVHQLLLDAAWLLEGGKLDQLRAVMAEFKLPRLPVLKNPDPEVVAARADIDRAKAVIKKLSGHALFQFAPSEWRANVAKTIWAADTFFALVGRFRAQYQAAKEELRALDFNDLERLALGLLRDVSDPVAASQIKPSAIALELHERFRHVLVDEYQDTNEVQDALLHLLSRECLGDACAAPNLFCVGDVKQSIYRFRHAEPTRFLDRAARFRDPAQNRGVTIDLQQNFRSRPPLLRVLNGVFALLMQKGAGDVDYDATQRLNSDKVFATHADGFTGASVELHLVEEKVIAGDDAAELADYDAIEREAAVIVERIRQIVGTGGGVPRQVAEEKDGELTTRNASYKDVVVLLRSMKIKAERLSSVLRRAGIPVETQSTTGFFGSLEIRDMLSLLRLLDNRRQDVPLASFLRSPLANLPRPEDALALVRLRYPARDATLAFHQAVERYIAEQPDDLAKDLRRAMSQVDEWRAASRSRPVAEVIWTVLQQTRYLTYVSGLSDGPQREANLFALHDRARQFGSFQRQGLARFLEFLENLQDESDMGQPNVSAAAEDAVRVMSIHKSKGLEFPIVIVADLGKQHNLSDARAQLVFEKSTGVAFDVVDADREIRYTSLAKVVAVDRVKKSALSEELRVLYVALTRAKEHLILVGTAAKDVQTTWADDWVGHRGRVPAGRVLTAKSMLEWLGAASAILNQKVAGVFEYFSYDADKLAELARRSAETFEKDQTSLRIAEMKPLSPEPIDDPAARRVIDRVSFVYPAHEIARVPAAAAVTQLTKAGRAAPGGRSTTTQGVVRFDTVLRPPRAVSADQTPTAAETGSVTHTLLQRLDFARPCDLPDLTAQLAALVAKDVIRPADAARVDLAAVAWLMGTAPGRLLRQHAADVLREFEIVFPRPTDANDPLLRTSDPADQVMVRGRIDLVIVTDEGLIVIDYKTDRVTSETIEARAEFYRPQVEAYRDVLHQITRRPVTATHVIFLTPREVRTM